MPLVIDSIIRSRRKSIGLSIMADARLIVRAPLWISEAQIRQVVAKKENWIKQKQDTFKNRAQLSNNYFSVGSKILFKGKWFDCTVADSQEKAVVLDGDSISVHRIALAHAKEHVHDWYVAQANEYLPTRTRELASAHRFSVNTIRINKARSRWGSCSRNGNIHFSWRLIMAPVRVIDYVIIHELAHLRELNHSARFWHIVRGMIADFKNDEKWLREHSSIMGIQ